MCKLNKQFIDYKPSPKQNCEIWLLGNKAKVTLQVGAPCVQNGDKYDKYVSQ